METVKALMELENQLNEMVKKLTPEEQAEFNRFNQKRLAIMKLPIEEQKAKLDELSKEYGVTNNI